MKFIDLLKSGLNKVLNNEQDFNVQLLACLERVMKTQAQSGLGDRTSYVGASDIGKCPRSAVLSKGDKPVLDLQQIIYFMRGHLSELIVMMALDAEKISYLYQPEIVHPTKGFVKAHIDFMYINADRVHTLEIKTGPIRPNTDFWIDQLVTQIGLIQMKHPDKTASGSVLNIDLTAGEMRYFNGFEHDEARFGRCMDRADLLWKIMHNPAMVSNHCEKGFLCADWCTYRSDCPAFSGAYPSMPALQSDFETFLERKLEKNTSYKQYKMHSDNLVRILKAINRKIMIGEEVVYAKKMTRSGGIDMARLKKEKPSVHKLISDRYMKDPTTYYQIENFTKVKDDQQAA